MKFRRSALVAFALMALAAPAFAGEHIDQHPGTGDSPPAGGVTSPALNVLISDVNSGLPIVGASGTLWSVPKQSWESPQIVGTARTGWSGTFYFLVPGYKGGDAFNLQVTATNYTSFTSLVWLTKAATTVAQVDIAVAPTGTKEGTPSGVKGTIASTWAQIKALY